MTRQHTWAFSILWLMPQTKFGVIWFLVVEFFMCPFLLHLTKLRLNDLMFSQGHWKHATEGP